jgi:ribonuclease HII
MQSIRFSYDEFIVLEKIAQSRSKKLSAFIRECCFAHIQNITEHEKLLASLKPEDSQEIQKTFFDALNNTNDAVLKSIEKLQLDMAQKFKLVDMLQRKIVYLHYFFNREVPPEDYGMFERSANKRTKLLLENID